MCELYGHCDQNGCRHAYLCFGGNWFEGATGERCPNIGGRWLAAKGVKCVCVVRARACACVCVRACAFVRCVSVCVCLCVLMCRAEMKHRIMKAYGGLEVRLHAFLTLTLND